MYLRRTFIIFLGLIMLGSCTKDTVWVPLELPPITTTGENTFGCLLNGEVWLPEMHFNMGGLHRLKASYFNGVVWITAMKKPGSEAPDIKQTIDLNVASQLADSMALTYPHDGSSVFIGAWANYHDHHTHCDYRTDSINGGFLQFLRFDSTAKVMSGIFEFTVVEPGCDTVFIREGRFDINY
jgi:hypothetical protein